MNTGQSLSKAALSLLRLVRPTWERYTEFPEYFDVRTTEFLLLTNNLRRAGVTLPPGRVLEVGCGMGYSLLLWSLMGAEGTGIDIPKSLKTARRLHLDFPPRGRVTLIEGHGENIPDSIGTFDLVTTQYVLEHVRDMGETIRQINSRIAPGGVAVHMLNSLTDRLAAYVEYRQSTQVHRRLQEAARSTGLGHALRYALTFTPPHEPRFGSYRYELAEYRLERWALRLLENGCEIIDHFQTRDLNWVLVTRPLH